jgi:hypothetical protein
VSCQSRGKFDATRELAITAPRGGTVGLKLARIRGWVRFQKRAHAKTPGHKEKTFPPNPSRLGAFA